MTKDQDMLQTEDQEALVVVTDDKGIEPCRRNGHPY